MLENSTPIDSLQRFFPHVSLKTNLVPRVFGGVCFVANHKPSHDKLDPRALRCIFIGYSSTQKGYRCYYPPTCRFFVTKDATFDEFLPYYFPCPPATSSSPSDSIDFLIPHPIVRSTLTIPRHPPSPFPSSPSDASQEASPSPNPTPLEASQEALIPPPQEAPSMSHPDPPPVPPYAPLGLPPLPPEKRYDKTWYTCLPTKSSAVLSPSPDSTHATLNFAPSCSSDVPEHLSPAQSHLSLVSMTSPMSPPLYPLAHYVSSHHLSSPFHAFLTSIDAISLPKTVDVALTSPPWRNAMLEELQALAKNDTWDLVPLPPGKHLVGSRWVYAVKQQSDGSLEWHKARVVAKGFTQKYDIDYQETFAPVAKMKTVRILLALAARRGWSLQQYDVKNVFLHGDLTEEIYMALPPGYYSLVPSTPSSVVCRLKKAL